jgi:hypothetical protein
MVHNDARQQGVRPAREWDPNLTLSFVPYAFCGPRCGQVERDTDGDVAGQGQGGEAGDRRPTDARIVVPAHIGAG